MKTLPSTIEDGNTLLVEKEEEQGCTLAFCWAEFI